MKAKTQKIRVMPILNFVWHPAVEAAYVLPILLTFIAVSGAVSISVWFWMLYNENWVINLGKFFELINVIVASLTTLIVSIVARIVWIDYFRTLKICVAAQR